MNNKTGTERIAEWLIQRCEERNLSYREASLGAGLSHGTISAILNGQPPGIHVCTKLAHYFGESPDKILRLAGHLPPESDGGNLDVALDEIALANVLRKERGKSELTVNDFGRGFFDSNDPMFRDFKLIWDILPYSERQKLIDMAEDLKRKQKGKSAEEGAAGKMTIGRTVEGTV
jgi:transcriptional regulator with XRE-family HTH domain